MEHDDHAEVDAYHYPVGLGIVVEVATVFKAAKGSLEDGDTGLCEVVADQFSIVLSEAVVNGDPLHDKEHVRYTNDRYEKDQEEDPNRLDNLLE